MLFPNLNFLFFQAGFGCVSDCEGCSRKYQKSRLGDINQLIKNIQEVKQRGIFSGNILIYNFDYFNIPKDVIQSILGYSLSYSKIYFHTDFRDLKELQIPLDINFIYQRDFSMSEVVFLSSFFSKNRVSEDSYFILWCDDFGLVGKFLKLLLYNKVSFTILEKDKTLLSISIGGSTLKFFLKDEERRNLKKCFFNKSINLLEAGEITFQKDIFHIGCLEVLINGDIRAHEPPCGLGNILISNIFRGNKQIKLDFLKFKKYIESLHRKKLDVEQKNICKSCNRLPYKYEK